MEANSTGQASSSEQTDNTEKADALDQANNPEQADSSEVTSDLEQASNPDETSSLDKASAPEQPSVAQDEPAASPVKPVSKKKVIVIAVVSAVVVVGIVAALFATHVLCIHDWGDATCTEPQICAICGRRQGEALGHEVSDWKVTKEPTCTTEGIEQGRCTRCGAIQTRAVGMLPHTQGHWETTRDWKFNSGGGVEAGEHVLRCTMCGEVLESETFTPELTTAEQGAGRFAMTMLFSDTGMSRDFLIQQLETQGFIAAESTLAIDHTGTDWNAEAVKSAEFYLQNSGGSRSMVTQWLSLQHFTDEQIEYACDKVGL